MMMPVMYCGKKYPIGVVQMWETCKFVSLHTDENIKNNPVQYIVIRGFLSSEVSSLCTGWCVFFMKGLKSKSKLSFTTVFNIVLRNEKLSWAAKGLYTYLESLPDDWVIYKSEIQKHSPNGRTAFETAWSELVGAGYIIEVDILNDKGLVKRREFAFYQLSETDRSRILTPAQNQQGGCMKSTAPPVENQQLLKTYTKDLYSNTEESNDSSDTNTFSSEGDKNSKEKEKKVAPKKKESDPCYKDMVAAWCEAYPILGFNGASGKCINEIITKTRKVMNGRGKEGTCEALVNSFKYVIAYVKREHHFCDGKPLTTWNSQYLSIVHEIANGKSKQKPLTTREKINQL